MLSWNLIFVSSHNFFIVVGTRSTGIRETVGVYDFDCEWVLFGKRDARNQGKGTVYTRHQSETQAHGQLRLPGRASEARGARAVRSHLRDTKGAVGGYILFSRWIQEVILGVGPGTGSTQGVLCHVHTMGNRTRRSVAD